MERTRNLSSTEPVSPEILLGNCASMKRSLEFSYQRVSSCGHSNVALDQGRGSDVAQVHTIQTK